MKICRGEVSGVKCKYFDEEFLGCNNNNRSGIIKVGLENCRHYSKFIMNEEVIPKNALAPAMIDGFILELASTKDEGEQEIYKSFIDLKYEEQLFVFYVAVEKIKPKKAIEKLFTDLDRKKVEAKARYLMTKPSILNAIEEFMKTSTEKLIQIQSTNIALKLMDASDEAVDEMIDDFKSGAKDENGYVKVKANDIIMAGKIHADTYIKYKKTEESVGNEVNMFTFLGDKKTLEDILENTIKLPEKIIEEDKKG